MDPFDSLDNLKIHFASIVFCRNSEFYNVRNGAVIELPVVVSINGFPRLLNTLLSFILSIDVLTNDEAEVAIRHGQLE